MWFDKLTTNGFNKLPFVLSLSKDLIGGSLGRNFATHSVARA